MIIIGITGFSCSGKTTLSKELRDRLGVEKCLLISMDDYFRSFTEEEKKIVYNIEAPLNIDNPERIQFDRLKSDLEHIRANKPVSLVFRETKIWKKSGSLFIEPGKYEYVIVEGIFVMTHQPLAALFDVTIWVETSEYVCALRRFYRYTQELEGYSPIFVVNYCSRNVMPSQEKYIKPYKSECDIMFNGENRDPKCVEMIAHFVRSSLDEKHQKRDATNSEIVENIADKP